MSTYNPVISTGSQVNLDAVLSSLKNDLPGRSALSYSQLANLITMTWPSNNVAVISQSFTCNVDELLAFSGKLVISASVATEVACQVNIDGGSVIDGSTGLAPINASGVGLVLPFGRLLSDIASGTHTLNVVLINSGGSGTIYCGEQTASIVAMKRRT